MEKISPEREAQELLSRICAALGLHEWDHVIIDTVADDVWVWQVKEDGHEMRIHCLPGIIRDWNSRSEEFLQQLGEVDQNPSLEGLEQVLVRVVE